MNTLTFVGDLIAVTASLVALYYAFRLWQMISARSRLFLLIAMGYVAVGRIFVTVATLIPGEHWVLPYRPLINVPQYILFAFAFGWTYYEIAHFNFDVPKDAEDTDMQDKRDEFLAEQSVPMEES